MPVRFICGCGVSPYDGAALGNKTGTLTDPGLKVGKQISAKGSRPPFDLRSPSDVLIVSVAATEQIFLVLLWLLLKNVLVLFL